jgi:hypothetical protein
VKALIKGPETGLRWCVRSYRASAARLVDGWLTFGDYHAQVIRKLPDNVSAAAFSMAVNAGRTDHAVHHDEGRHRSNS